MIVLMIPRSRFFSSVLRFWNNFSDFNRGDVVPSRYFCVSILIRRHRDRHLRSSNAIATSATLLLGLLLLLDDVDDCSDDSPESLFLVCPPFLE